MHASKRKLLILALVALTLTVLTAFLFTRQTEGRRNAENKSAKQATLIDQAPFRTALSLQSVASTAPEQELAFEALHLADREVDIAFASALQKAKETPPAQNKETAEINSRIKFFQGRLQSEQQEVERLTNLAAKPGKDDASTIQQQLEIAQAQAELLQDGLDDSRQDLVRAGGDPEALIQRELEDHEGLQHGGGNASPPPTTKPATFEVEGDLLSQYRTWQRLRENYGRLLEAQQQANDAVNSLTQKHGDLQKGLSDSFQTVDSGEEANSALARGAPPTPATNPSQHAAKLATINKLSQKTKTLASYDKRIDLERQIAGVYGDWAGVVSVQLQQTLHAILRSLLWIFLALLGLALVEGAIERFYFKLGPDRRRLGTTRLALRFVSQMIGILIVLLVMFGPPSQLSTVLALAGAGLTVALKDFVVAFFGWFVLMGRNGIRVGDWVEIEGIGGEVMEIDLLRTIVLETGNWNDAGHPTGRRVSFVNSFAVEGHYFNFTTTGQWLWDELDILIPAGEDPYELTNSVLTLVTEQTQADSASAEQEWRRVTHNSAMQSFSAVPAIEVRPTNLGVNLVVRYIAHAHSRHEVRTRLYQAIVELLHGKKIAPDRNLSATTNS
jgi:small-conductance mechanosensitive channel